MSKKEKEMMKLRNTICARCSQIRKVVDGKELRTIRIKNNLSLREVARWVDISPSYLCDIEHNRRLSPRRLIDFWKRIELNPQS